MNSFIQFLFFTRVGIYVSREKFMVFNLGSKIKQKTKSIVAAMLTVFLSMTSPQSIRSLRDGIFIPPHAVILDPLHKTNPTTQIANG